MACTVQPPSPVSPAPSRVLGPFCGHIQLILGPMFSGKSTELMRRIRRYTHAKLRCVIIKYKKDTRYSEESMATHDRSEAPAVPCNTLAEAAEAVEGMDVVGIDEGQFFPDLLDFCETNANAGRIVIVASLDGTFQRVPFGQICDLVPRAEKVDKLTAVCKVCTADAAFSKRISSDTSVELIGGGDMYWPVCRRCFFTVERPRSRAASLVAAELAGVNATATKDVRRKTASPSPTNMADAAADVTTVARPTAMRHRVTAPAPRAPRATSGAGSGDDDSGDSDDPARSTSAREDLVSATGVSFTVGFSSGRGI